MRLFYLIVAALLIVSAYADDTIDQIDQALKLDDNIPTTIKSTSREVIPLGNVEDEQNETRTLPVECGWSKPIPSYLGESAISKLYPWMVAVLRTWLAESHEAYLGAGTLIHPKVVLTVAHMLSNINSDELTCRAERIDLELSHQDRTVTKIVIHEELNKFYAYYDAALLFLESPFTLSEASTIGVACLARDNLADTSCYALGWNDFTRDERPNLRKAQMSLTDRAACERQLRRTRYGTRYTLHRSLTCAAPHSDEPCLSSRGSPLMCLLQTSDSGTRYVLYGMGAYGETCLHYMPMVFAKVPVMVDWVDRMMDAEGLDKTTYRV